MAETEQLEQTKITPTPALLRARVLRLSGWALLLLSLVLLGFHVLWMWQRLGRGALLVAIALSMDALVGLGLIMAGNKIQRKP